MAKKIRDEEMNDAMAEGKMVQRGNSVMWDPEKANPSDDDICEALGVVEPEPELSQIAQDLVDTIDDTLDKRKILTLPPRGRFTEILDDASRKINLAPQGRFGAAAKKKQQQ